MRDNAKYYTFPKTAEKIVQARVFLATLVAIAATGSVFPAYAHPHLEKAQPAADSKTAQVKEIRMTFSESVESKLSSIRLETDTERTVTEPEAQADPADSKTLVVRLFEGLAPGNYRVRWAAVGSDGHRVTGTYSFLVSR
jgi:methionine-rich copper-binding protein CopC